MKKLVILLSILLTACGTGDNQSGTKEMITQSEVIDQVEYTLSIYGDTFDQNDMIEVNASVKNTGNEPVSYIGYNGCDDGFHTTIAIPNYSESFLEENWDQQEPQACTEAIETHTLDPGEELKEQKSYIPKMRVGSDDVVPVPTGRYSVKVIFQKGSLDDLEKHRNDFQLSIPITVNGSGDLITAEQAVKVASNHHEVKEWISNRMGSAVTNYENEDYFVMHGGDWMKTSEEQYRKTLDYEPQHTKKFDSGSWIVSYYDKLQGPPHRIEVHVDSQSGDILKVTKFEK